MQILQTPRCPDRPTLKGAGGVEEDVTLAVHVCQERNLYGGEFFSVERNRSSHHHERRKGGKRAERKA